MAELLGVARGVSRDPSGAQLVCAALSSRASPVVPALASSAESIEKTRSVAEESSRLLDGLPFVLAVLNLLAVLTLISANTRDFGKIKQRLDARLIPRTGSVGMFMQEESAFGNLVSV